MGLSEELCNQNLDSYLQICKEIGLPTSAEKTVPATRTIVFLGLVLDGKNRSIGIPEAKVVKALNQIDLIDDSKKAMILQLQRITGLLNFFCRAIVPGRAFTRRLYAAFSHSNLKQHHHVRVTNELKLDLGVWRQFLAQDQKVLRPFVEFDSTAKPKLVWVTSDAAKSPSLGFATCFMMHDTKEIYYAYDQRETGLLESYDPSVQFLELVALTAGVVLFSEVLANSGTITLWCDNQVVLHMVNNGASSCPHCMKLIRIITLFLLKYNIKYQVNFIPTRDNRNSDLLSRLKTKEFLAQVPVGWTPKRVLVPAPLMPVTKFFN